MTERVTLRAGDYVSTAGMTEAQYHAVARAFMAAGAASAHFNRFVLKHPMSTWKFIGWGKVTGNLNGENSLRKISRHLTISQFLNATDAGNKEEDMTPCESLGYKVGDRFRVIYSRHPDRDGSIITLSLDDGTRSPFFKSPHGDTWVFRIDNSRNDVIEKVEDDTLTQTLRDASEHDEKAKHHAEEHDRLMQRARDMLPDGWRLVRDGEPEADMDDPASWREGDVVECVDEFPMFCHKGGLYVVNSNHLSFGGKLRLKADDDGDAATPPLQSFRFHHRPT